MDRSATAGNQPRFLACGRVGFFASRLRGMSAIGMGAEFSRLRTTASNWPFGTLGVSATVLFVASRI